MQEGQLGRGGDWPAGRLGDWTAVQPFPPVSCTAGRLGDWTAGRLGGRPAVCSCQLDGWLRYRADFSSSYLGFFFCYLSNSGKGNEGGGVKKKGMVTVPGGFVSSFLGFFFAT